MSTAWRAPEPSRRGYRPPSSDTAPSAALATTRPDRRAQCRSQTPAVATGRYAGMSWAQWA
eukprot:5355601-Prymnesium_polylepis.1